MIVLSRSEASFCGTDLPTVDSLHGLESWTVLPSGTDRVGREARSGRSATLIEPLSERELEAVRLMAEGLTNEQIASRLTIALGRAKMHVHNLAAKLGAQNRAQAVARAKESNLL